MGEQFHALELAQSFTLERLIGFAPLTVLVLGIVGLGYYVGRRSQREFIEHLKDQLKERR